MFTPFTRTGALPSDAVYELPTPPPSLSSSISLKTFVRTFTSSSVSLKSYDALKLYMILPRLRSLQYTINKYNEGVRHSTSAFEQYWKPRTLNWLSGVGFQVKEAKEIIVIDGLDDLVKDMEEVYSAEISDAREKIASGLITFEGLGELYRPDNAIEGRTTLGGTNAVFMVTDAYYEEHRSLVGMEKSFHMTLDFIATVGNHFTVVTFTEVLSGWMGVQARAVGDLTYAPVKMSQLDVLRARGEKYVEYSSGGAQFLAYGSHTFFLHSTSRGGGSSLMGSRQSVLPSGGRVMIDAARGAELGHYASQGVDEATQAMINRAGQYRRWVNTRTSAGGTSKASSDALPLWSTVPSELRMYTWPALVGFSFSAKAWGHVLVSGLTSINFQHDAFDRLVLAEDRKQLIRALVRFGSDPDTEDIVSNKRGGSIFLLHGPPGVGKTLTAEAIAEVLQRPLYYVTMGELGLTPDDMEKRLTDVLSLCAEWNALVLLDEADVFLEQRATSDIVRNAMVVVMLRLLEYHPGILFLTTNRVRSFDPAFESRVTVALRYDQLSFDARKQIWRNLLGRVKIGVAEGVDFERLAGHVLNGRQIKNAVRLAVALAREMEAEQLTQEILDRTLAVVNLGREDMRNDDSWRE
ncbi:hypothetical protein HDV00_011633 [Rhizophlyctis rosea]|nr:hypothetical protein HDV00_011633 [Rhizophlyctis rosea]